MEKKGKSPFHVILLGIIFDPKKKKILIGRRENDADIPQLTWGFPEGRLRHGDDIDKILKRGVKTKTGYDVKNLGAIFSKTYPEQKDLLAIYFLCEVFGGEAKPSDDFIELKWVSPEELEKYFTTSFHSRLKEYIMSLK